MKKFFVARLAKIISDKYKNTWKMTKNDSPSAILLCTSIITILLTVKLHNILFQQIFITSFITKISMPKTSMPQHSVTKDNYPIMNCTLLQLQ